MEPLEFIDRETGEKISEQVYGDKALKFLYGKSSLARFCCSAVSKYSLFSCLYGFLMKSSLSKRKIASFVNKYEIDTKEFLNPLSSFQSFNDFFTRKLKPSSRPIDISSNAMIIPADGRYLFYPKIENFSIKGTSFDLDRFLLDKTLSTRYQKGSLVIARLCPTDYHRFHFPCNCTPSDPKLINGYYYSVNPVAIRQNLSILWENKRVLTELKTENFGTILYVEVGATNVGSIHQTYQSGIPCMKGSEKGYFSFGGSSIILLMEKGAIHFCEDLLSAMKEGIEIRCLMGQTMGYH